LIQEKVGDSTFIHISQIIVEMGVPQIVSAISQIVFAAWQIPINAMANITYQTNGKYALSFGKN
jgi:hypothetical protein